MEGAGGCVIWVVRISIRAIDSVVHSCIHQTWYNDLAKELSHLLNPTKKCLKNHR